MFFTDQFTFSFKYSTYTDTFNLYGLHTITNPALFPGDRGADLFRDTVANPGAGTFLFVLLYKSLLALTDLPCAMKTISLLSAFLSAFLIYRAGLLLTENKDTAFLLTSFHTIYFLSMNSFYFGQPRTLGALINSLLIYTLCSKKYLLIPFFTPLFYATYSYLAFSSSILAVATPVFRKKELAGHGRSYLTALVLAATLTLLTTAGTSSKILQNQTGLFKYKSSSSAGIQMDSRNVADILVNFVFNINEYSLLYLILTCLLLTATCTVFFKNGRQSLKPLTKAFGPACASFLAGFILLYPLNPVFAARQLSLILPSMIALAAGLAAAELSGEKIKKALPWLAALLFMALHPFFNYITDFKSFSGIYHYIGGLPVGSTLAGDPSSMVYAGVPLYAKRKIFFAQEISSVYIAAGGDVKRSSELLFQVLCTDSVREIRETAGAEKITHFLVEEEFYRKHRGCQNTLFTRAREAGIEFKTTKGRIYLLDTGKI